MLRDAPRALQSLLGTPPERSKSAPTASKSDPRDPKSDPRAPNSAPRAPAVLSERSRAAATLENASPLRFFASFLARAREFERTG